jgi:Homeodomain-like domain
MVERHHARPAADPRREAMLEPEEVSAILRLNELGWGAKRIARELGISRNTARDYITAVQSIKSPWDLRNIRGSKGYACQPHWDRSGGGPANV